MHHFRMFVFMGVHFNDFGVIEHIMNAVTVCIAERQSLRCVWFTFLYNEPKFLLVKTVVMSCSPAVMYSVCKPDISETSKSEPVYDLLAIISSEHT